MEKLILSRQYLESSSTQDLLSIADDYGIDLPANLNRRFIIEEILDSVAEQEQDGSADTAVTFTEEQVALDATLPFSYNETSIHAILRDPSWAFVFWDIKESDLDAMRTNPSYSFLSLTILFFDGATDEKASDSIEIRVSIEDREQYVLLSSPKRHFVVNLVCHYEDAQPRVLAGSKRISIPAAGTMLAGIQPGKKMDIPPLIQLSGMDLLLREQYLNHHTVHTA